jgi:hypothetical protein
MKTLVIHPQDYTTDFLAQIYHGQYWTVISTNVSKSFLTEQIKMHDRIIMLGHGTPAGLLGFNHYVIDSNYVYLLREKECVCIWCNADEFVKKYGLKGFYTGMIISEYEEALAYSIKPAEDQIVESNTSFAFAIKNSINTTDMLQNALKFYRNFKDNPIIEFNRNHLYYSSLFETGHLCINKDRIKFFPYSSLVCSLCNSEDSIDFKFKEHQLHNLKLINTAINLPKEIKIYADLPEYGKYVLVYGIDKNQYGLPRWHVCEMNDLEDGMEFKENGHFYWLTESGRKIDEVTKWCYLPE